MTPPYLRRVGAAVAALALTTAAVPSGTGSDRPASARTTVRLLDVGVDAPLADQLTAALGDLQLVSGRLDEGDAEALIGLVGAQALGVSAGELGWSTAQGNQRGDASVPVSAGGVDGLIQLLGYAVEASGRDARSHLTGLEGSLAAGPVALELGSDARGIATSVAGDASAATTSLALSSVDLRLGDLLPDGLLDRLPLGVLLDLVDRLPVSLPEIEALVEQLEELVAGLREVTSLMEEISETRKELLALVESDPAVDAAAKAVASAEATLRAAQKDLTAAIGARDDAAQALSDAQADLAAAVADAADTIADLQQALDDALDAEAAAQQAVAAATAVLTSAQAELNAATSDLADAQAVVTGLQSDLTDVQQQMAGLNSIVDAVLLGQLQDQADALSGQIAAAEATVTTLSGTVTAADAAVTAAEADLAAAQGVLAGAGQAVAAAEAALATSSPAVTAATQAVNGAQAALGSAQSAVEAARATVSGARTTLESALTELDRTLVEIAETVGETATKLTERLSELRRELTGVLEQLRTVAIALPDLGDLLDQLRDALADVPVVSLGELGITLDLSADARSASAVVDCELGAVTVLGRSIADPTCAEANELIAGVPDLLAELLSALPVELPVPAISGLDIRTTASDGPDADGITRAAAAITGLRVQVPSVELSGILDQLTAELEELIGTALDAQGLLASAPLTVPLGMSRMATDPLTEALAQLQAQLDGLPVGGALDGLRTVGIDVTVASLQSEVLSGAALLTPLDADEPLPGLPTDTPEGPTTGAPGVPSGGDPDDPAGAPGDPDGPSLPVTGGGAVLLPAALMLGAAILRRRW